MTKRIFTHVSAKALAGIRRASTGRVWAVPTTSGRFTVVVYEGDGA